MHIVSSKKFQVTTFKMTNIVEGKSLFLFKHLYSTKSSQNVNFK